MREHPERPEPVAFSAEVERLTGRLREMRDKADPRDLAVLLQDLETAVEELRVADEEVRTQHEQVARLLESRDLLRWRQERMIAGLPVPVLTTDRSGRLRSVNPAAAALFGMRVDHLLRKPLFVFVAEGDRASLRQLLIRAARGEATDPQPTTLDLRDRVARVAAAVTPSPDADGVVTWVLLRGDRDEPAAAPSRGNLPGALLTLSALPTQGSEPHVILQRAAYVVGHALGPGAEAILTLGPPLAPTAVASTATTAQAFDRLQLEAGEGPSVTCFESSATVVADDLATDSRRRRLRDACGSSAFRSCVAAPMLVPGDVSGTATALLAQGRGPAGQVVETVEVLAAAVASLVQELGLRSQVESLAEDMRSALASRAVIDQAKGVVMAHKHCSAEEAFQHLVTLSNTTHQKLREVAQHIVEQSGG